MFAYLSVCMSVCLLSVCPFLCLYVCHPDCLSVLLFSLSVSMSICFSVYLSSSLFVSLSFNLSAHSSGSLSVCLFRLFLRPSVCLPSTSLALRTLYFRIISSVTTRFAVSDTINLNFVHCADKFQTLSSSSSWVAGKKKLFFVAPNIPSQQVLNVSY
jgi:hypothetical protein